MHGFHIVGYVEFHMAMTRCIAVAEISDPLRRTTMGWEWDYGYCQSGNRMPASLHPIFVMRRLTLRCLLIIGSRCSAGSKTAGNRYADLLLASFVYIFEEGVVHVSKQ